MKTVKTDIWVAMQRVTQTKNPSEPLVVPYDLYTEFAVSMEDGGSLDNKKTWRGVTVNVYNIWIGGFREEIYSFNLVDAYKEISQYESTKPTPDKTNGGWAECSESQGMAVSKRRIEEMEKNLDIYTKYPKKDCKGGVDKKVVSAIEIIEWSRAKAKNPAFAGF